MPSVDALLPALLAVPTVMLICQAAGRAAIRLGQPAVIGEILAGLLLGPSLLGWLAPALQHQLLATAALPALSTLGNLALLTFLFLMGLELDLRSLHTTRTAVVSVSLCGIALPGTLGALLGIAMYPHLAPAGVDQLPFVAFIAIALSITAFPVLARILADKGLEHTPLGTFVMSSAAIDDAVAWCLLIAVVALCNASTPLSALTAVGLVIVLVATLLLLRPTLRRLLTHAARKSDDLLLVILFVGLLLTAYATDRIGVHPAFGAFLFGAVIPRGEQAVERSTARIRCVIVPVFLPLYFVSIGLQTNLAGLTFGLWGWGLLVLTAAVVGKWGGAAVAARLTGAGWRKASAVGVLMNCRGLTELVVLGIGLHIGVLTSQLYGILVLMAVVTTVATAPLLTLLTRVDTCPPHSRTPAEPAPPVPPASTAQETAK